MMAVLPRRRRRHPASLGGLPLLARLDLSFNNLFGSIPVRLARLHRLVALDVRNNPLTGSVPAELAAKFQAGFQYGNDLCGAGLPALRPDLINLDRPQPFSAGISPQVTAPYSRPRWSALRWQGEGTKGGFGLESNWTRTNSIQ
uniref:Leucine-rich repeat-containing N-terminal plant-type domain-containing protein n=1 Tax=Setaria viridis TaxID=4556 RepID=A0A4U6TXQ7_SETVI|nr:LRR receptor kinase BAK1-like [Setaria viridis]TKW07780.1 hypothetical protein SEVIR_7G329400v2 [Setaria viridis]